MTRVRLWGALGHPWDALWCSRGHSWVPLGRSWALLGALRVPLTTLGELFGAPVGSLGLPSAAHGHSGSLLGTLGALLGARGFPLGALGRSWVLLGGLGVLLGTPAPGPPLISG